ncbi:PIN domain-containing protein [Blastococcus sp. LR1]|uniref:PIN domain-containing protein n=1 Tax=Blastococcus sp. LR1 TaxID=2877000 RepID=UPI001CC9C384|nr:PIN domain-containing protein [Blastococcus sp. LR1]MCA0144262.1 PIN domain-containing protein [Blastococcus sp. LR1]
MLHLLVDTSTWLDLCKRRDGQRWIVALRVLAHQGQVELLVPRLVIDEFERNRDRVETSMTASIAQRFKLIKQDLDDYGGTAQEEARRLVADLARHVPLIGAMTTRNFDEVLVLLQAGRVIEPGDEEKRRVVERGLSKQAPFHRSRNSVADALLIELYETTARGVDLDQEPHAFITSNSDDFSLPGGDARQPHPDLASLFVAEGSTYGLGVDGLNQVLLDYFGDEIEELFAETYFEEEPRRLDEIVEAERELFDRIWYHRSLQHEYRLEDAGDDAELKRLLAIAGPGRRRVEGLYTEPGQLGPYTDFELGMLNGKLSALRWVLGSEWDFLDT